MWNEPTPEQLKQLPRLYATEYQPLAQKLVHMHFFIGGCDWYMTEYDPGDRLFFGYAILNGDLENAEWGYVSLDELRAVKTRQGFQIDRDLHWKPTPVSQIEKIVEADNRQGRR